MDETKELLKASFGRLEGLIGEVKELRYKIKDVQGNMESLRAALKERPPEEGGADHGEPGEQAGPAGKAGEPGGEGGQGGGEKTKQGDRDGQGDQKGQGDRNGESGDQKEQGQRKGEGGDGKDGGDLEERVARIERKLAYLGEKWLELDEKLYHLQRNRG